MKPRSFSRPRGRLALAAPVFFSLLAAAAVAHAQIDFYGAQKTTFYTQTADDTAPTVNDYSEFGFVTTSDPAEAASFLLSSNGTVPLTSSPSDPTSFGGSNFYSTKGALDADFPAGGTYTFTAQGGSLDGQSGALPIGADAYPAALFVAGNGFSAAMAVSPDADFSFELGSTGTGASATALSLNLFDPSGNAIYSANYDATETRITLPQSEIDALTPGVVYTATLDNFNTGGTEATGDFAGAPNSDGFVSTTGFPLEVVPEPREDAILLAGSLGLALALRRGAAVRRS